MQNTDNNRIDELLAAYLEGNTTPDETLQVLQAIKSDPVIRETLNLALSVELEEELETIPMMQMAAESGKNICGVMCEAYILRRRDIDFKENELLDVARENLWLKEKGTPLHSIGQLLVHEGLLVTRKYDATC